MTLNDILKVTSPYTMVWIHVEYGDHLIDVTHKPAGQIDFSKDLHDISELDYEVSFITMFKQMDGCPCLCINIVKE